MVFTCFLGISAASRLLATEEPDYTVLRQADDIELRDYPPMIVAETVVDGDFEDAGNRAFRKLFNYIDGANVSRQKIEMTAPVSQQPRSEKIAMTAPVGQQAAAEGWAVSFMMPAGYTMETVPEPTDPTVVIREIPAHRAAAIRYSGFWSEKSYRKHLARIEEWMRREQLEADGGPVWARYNAPFTPWFLRRNEVLIPVR
jgi:effector-binding domain-containing protein